MELPQTGCPGMSVHHTFPVYSRVKTTSICMYVSFFGKPEKGGGFPLGTVSDCQ